MNLAEGISQATVWIIPILVAITLHEAAHAYAAYRLGDGTAKLLGRVSFNPFKHVDPVGTVALPAFLLMTGTPFLFGWAKPVPVNFRNLLNPKRDMMLVAAAGPAINFILAFISAALMHIVYFIPEAYQGFLMNNLVNSLHLNIILALFNLLPIPPLDGGRIAVGLLPYKMASALARLERYGFIILIVAIFVLPSLIPGLNVFHTLILTPANWILRAMLFLVGL